MSDKIQFPSPLIPGLTGTGMGARDAKSGKDQGVADPFQGLNLDSFGLSEGARNKVIWARSQFEVNYQTLRSMNSANGKETSIETFSFRGSYEFLMKVSGQTPVAADGTDSPVEESAETPDSEKDVLARLQDFFSPEKTAERILDVAVSFFGVSETRQTGGNNETARRKFADFIGAAIEEGFKQARNLLGSLPDEVSSGIEQTHSIVFTGLEEFVKNGVNAEKTAAGGVLEKIAAYRLETSQKTESLKKAFATKGYNAKGEPV